MNAAIERRAFELRASEDGSELKGIALPYRGERGFVGRFSEEFRAGAIQFAPSGVFLNVGHRDDRLLAKFPDGGLDLTDAPDALHLRAVLPDTAEGRDTRQLVRSGVLGGLSVEFVCKRDEWRGTHRIVHEAVLGGVAIVARPAYAGAVVREGREMRTEDYLQALCSPAGGVKRWRSL